MGIYLPFCLAVATAANGFRRVGAIGVGLARESVADQRRDDAERFGLVRGARRWRARNEGGEGENQCSENAHNRVPFLGHRPLCGFRSFEGSGAASCLMHDSASNQLRAITHTGNRNEHAAHSNAAGLGAGGQCCGNLLRSIGKRLVTRAAPRAARETRLLHLRGVRTGGGNDSAVAVPRPGVGLSRVNPGSRSGRAHEVRGIVFGARRALRRENEDAIGGGDARLVDLETLIILVHVSSSNAASPPAWERAGDAAGAWVSVAVGRISRFPRSSVALFLDGRPRPVELAGGVERGEHVVAVLRFDRALEQPVAVLFAAAVEPTRGEFRAPRLPDGLG